MYTFISSILRSPTGATATTQTAMMMRRLKAALPAMAEGPKSLPFAGVTSRLPTHDNYDSSIIVIVIIVTIITSQR